MRNSERTPVTRGEDKENVVESKSVQKLEKWTRKPKEEPVGEEADPECTFKPKLVASQPETVPNETKLDVYERNQRWAEARRKRVEEVKRGDEGRDLDKCTFYPSTEVSQKSLGQVPPKDTQTAAPTRGIDKFIKRQEAARAMKEEKEKLLNNLSKGQSWKNKVTIPQSPRLGEHGSRREEDSPARGHRIKDIFNDPLDIHVTDVTWGEAVRILHDELQRLSFDFD
eukprot:TRINITY_DN1687_c0_g1_i1.p1 TRINITY_DN1687_c0_g1~~TRINITY_DN1687_c0_g1_i1.p1  ORF type:complete len:226 (+),score=63.17 TRINITY_DN1687_c0_g1_i1:744-1421(+)